MWWTPQVWWFFDFSVLGMDVSKPHDQFLAGESWRWEIQRTLRIRRVTEYNSETGRQEKAKMACNCIFMGDQRIRAALLWILGKIRKNIIQARADMKIKDHPSTHSKLSHPIHLQSIKAQKLKTKKWKETEHTISSYLAPLRQFGVISNHWHS